MYTLVQRKQNEPNTQIFNVSPLLIFAHYSPLSGCHPQKPSFTKLGKTQVNSRYLILVISNRNKVLNLLFISILCTNKLRIKLCITEIDITTCSFRYNLNACYIQKSHTILCRKNKRTLLPQYQRLQQLIDHSTWPFCNCINKHYRRWWIVTLLEILLWLRLRFKTWIRLLFCLRQCLSYRNSQVCKNKNSFFKHILL